MPNNRCRHTPIAHRIINQTNEFNFGTKCSSRDAAIMVAIKSTNANGPNRNWRMPFEGGKDIYLIKNEYIMNTIYANNLDE